MTDYVAVLTALYPDAEWSLSGDSYDGLVWHSEGDAPSQAELDAAWPQVDSDRKWAAVRAERDRLLAASDWTQMPDNALDAPTIAAWAAYRQELRDVPQTQDDPDSIVWPEAP